ncbi:MAG TPA: hypothetical protein VMY37_36700 [Thermoguttaceae bacterium]|nr:hypothetical protein [Thermoguttaceae bacterium]
MTEVNPYQSPQAVDDEYADVSVAEDPAIAAKRARTVRSIRAICLLYVLFGTIAVLAGIALLVDNSQPQASPVLGWVLLVGGCAGIISAIGVVRKRSWGIPVCQIVSAVYLLNFPSFPGSAWERPNARLRLAPHTAEPQRLRTGNDHQSIVAWLGTIVAGQPWRRRTRSTPIPRRLLRRVARGGGDGRMTGY